jgi:uncharacterized protein YqgV (UPF0045/DUF77 family)
MDALRRVIFSAFDSAAARDLEEKIPGIKLASERGMEPESENICLQMDIDRNRGEKRKYMDG